jgi:Na+-translocating ferredoxin:NAD+ oxidoreductase subunit G
MRRSDTPSRSSPLLSGCPGEEGWKTEMTHLKRSFLALSLCGFSTAVQARVFTTQSQALEKAFPAPLKVERKTLYLTDSQVAAIQTLAGARVESKIHSYYVARGTGGVAGIALFDTQPVRTMPVTYMVLLKPDGEIQYVEILGFFEPEDYLPRPSWLRLFERKTLSDDLRLKRDIPNVTGASLTSLTLMNGVRRLAAIYKLAIAPSIDSTPKKAFDRR